MDENLTYFLLGLVIAIPVGIFTNIVTPSVERWLLDKPSVSAKKEFSALQSELNEITELNINKNKLYLKTIRTLFIALLSLSCGNLALALAFELNLLAFWASVVGFCFFLITILVCLNHIRLVSKVISYEGYKKNIEVKIARIKNSRNPSLTAKNLVIESAWYSANN